MTTKEKFKNLIDNSDDETIRSIANEFLSIEYVKGILERLDNDTKKEILDNFPVEGN